MVCQAISLLNHISVAGRTPYYLFHPEVPQRIKSQLPAVKLIVLLRDPVEQALSQFFHSRRLGLEPLELEAAIAAEPQRLADAAEHLAAGKPHRSHQQHSYLNVAVMNTNWLVSRSCFSLSNC